ncbi:MAG: hypothetical protein JO214_12365 [Frankiaceae bacterium]|nr:hypothetical protein [Frankiaceae bacterium]
MKRLIGGVAALLTVAALAGCGGSAKAAAPTKLAGQFGITPGHCTTPRAKPTGSYFVAISAAAGHALQNRAGGCANPSYTPLAAGTDGGLITGEFQPQPAKVFDANRNSRAVRLFAPVRFGHYRLGFATSARDEQHAPAGAPAYPPPAAIVTGDTLSVDLRSLVLTYAGRSNSSCRASFGVGCFNLGSKNATGTYDATTHRYVIDWFSGAAFTPNGDSMEFHLEGTFTAGSNQT